MAYLFNNRGVSHLAFSIGSGDTEIRIPWEDFNQFMRSTAGELDTMMAILRGPVNREIVEIDLTNSFSGPVDKYLKVARGQGGTSAMDWPAGTLLFISTHADHYNACFQPDGTRQIDFNPNGVLSPNYAGEKILQYAGCQIRWWQSFDAINPYWHLIAGLPCDNEEFVDPGWGFKVWFVTELTCFDVFLDDTFWRPFSDNPLYGLWGSGRWESSGPIPVYPLYLFTTGSWAVGFRPAYGVVYRPEPTPTGIFRLYDALGGILHNAPGGTVIGPDGYQFKINNPSDRDIGRLYMSSSGPSDDGVVMTNLEFFICDEQEVAPLNFGDAEYHNVNWNSCRNATVGTDFSEGGLLRIIANLRPFATPDYQIERGFCEFDVSGVTITNIFKIALRVQQFATSTPGANVTMILQESTADFPMDFGDYDSFVGVPPAPAGPAFSDPVVNGPSGVALQYDFELNQDGIDYVVGKLGTANPVKFCIREFTHDYAGATPITGYANQIFIIGLIIQGT